MTRYALKCLKDYSDIANALGNMIVAWAYAEDHLVVALHNVSGMPANVALAVYHHAHTFDTRIKMILAAMKESKLFNNLEKRRALEDILEKLSKLSYQRNGYVHGAWQIDDETKIITLYQMRADIESARRKKIVKASEILQHTKAVLKQVENLIETAGGISEV